MAFLYYRPLASYLQTRSELGARRAQVVALRAEKVRLERRLARTTSDAALAREARRIGYVEAGRAALHRQGHRRLAAQSPRRDAVELLSRGGSRRRRAPDRPAPPGVPAGRGPLPVRPSRRHRAGAVRRRGRAVPDDLLPHLPPPRRGRLAARGSRRRRALERRRRGEPRADAPTSTRRPACSSASGTSSPPGRTGADHGASLDSGIGGSRNPSQLKCLHAHVAFALAQPGYRIGELVLAEVPEPFPPHRCCSAPSTAPREHRRRQRPPRLGGRQPPLRARLPRRGRRPSASARQLDLISAELRRRVGSTFTLAMLADAYAGSDAWTLQAVEEHAPTPGWARSVSMVGDAAFHVYARGAVDYTP